MDGNHRETAKALMAFVRQHKGAGDVDGVQLLLMQQGAQSIDRLLRDVDCYKDVGLRYEERIRKLEEQLAGYRGLIAEGGGGS